MIAIMKQPNRPRNWEFVKGGLIETKTLSAFRKRRTGWVPSHREQWELEAKPSAREWFCGYLKNGHFNAIWNDIRTNYKYLEDIWQN